MKIIHLQPISVYSYDELSTDVQMQLIDNCIYEWGADEPDDELSVNEAENKLRNAYGFLQDGSSIVSIDGTLFARSMYDERVHIAKVDYTTNS